MLNPWLLKRRRCSLYEFETPVKFMVTKIMLAECRFKSLLNVIDKAKIIHIYFQI